MDEPTPKQRLRFGIRTLLEIIAVFAFVLALVYARDERARGNGRYQMSNTQGPNVFVVDTKTGRVWAFDMTNPSVGWIERAPPIPPQD